MSIRPWRGLTVSNRSDYKEGIPNKKMQIILGVRNLWVWSEMSIFTLLKKAIRNPVFDDNAAFFM